MTSWIPLLALALAPRCPKASDDPAWAPCIVRVVDGATHTAVPGAEVWWLDPGALDLDARRIVLDRWLVPEEWIRRFGHSATTDANGDVAIQEPQSIYDQRTFVAWHHGKFARFDLDHGLLFSRIVPLELEDDPGQLVRVLDEHGAPVAGVEVAAWCDEHGICLNCGPRDERIWSAPTDVRGEVVLPHAAWYFRTSDAGGNLGERLHHVGLGFPTRPRKRLGAADRRGEPPAIELVAPPLDPLELEFRTEAGERCTGELSVVLAVGAPNPNPFIGTGSPFGFWIARDGRLSLPHVERGLHFFISYARSEPRGELFDDVAVPDVDPSAPESPRVVRANGHVLRLSGRAVDGQGRPRAGASLGADWVRGDPKDDERNLRFEDCRSKTDAEGRFVFDFFPRDCRPPGKKEHRVVGIAVSAESRRFSDFGPVTRVTIADDADVATYDVGDVTLEPPPFSLSGRVLDASGRPVAGAAILVIDGPADLNTSRRNVAISRTDAAGAFVSYQHESDGPFSLLSGEAGWRLVGVRTHRGAAIESPETRFPIGSSDVELVFAQCGGVRGRVLLPEGARADDYEVTVEANPDGAAERARESVNAPRDRIDWYPDGAFEVRGPEHRVFVRCRPKGVSGVGHRSENVVLPASGIDESIELEIDLRAPRRTK